MSLSARLWAREVDLGKADPAVGRFVPSMLRHLLKEVSDFDQGTGEVYAFVSTLVRYTDMDRKTVLAYLAELVRRGLLRDTGRRAGKTKQTPIYELVGFVPDFARPASNPNSPAQGTLPSGGSDATESNAQHADSEEEFTSIGDANTGDDERVPRKGPLENERVPSVPAKSPAEERKESRRRDTNSSLNLTKHSDARAPARRAARASDHETDLGASPAQAAADARRYWHTQVHSEFLDAVGCAFPDLWRRPLKQLPQRLADLVREASAPIIQRLVDRQLATGLEPRLLAAELRAMTGGEAERVIGLYRSALTRAA